MQCGGVLTGAGRASCHTSVFVRHWGRTPLEGLMRLQDGMRPHFATSTLTPALERTIDDHIPLPTPCGSGSATQFSSQDTSHPSRGRNSSLIDSRSLLCSRVESFGLSKYQRQSSDAFERTYPSPNHPRSLGPFPSLTWTGIKRWSISLTAERTGHRVRKRWYFDGKQGRRRMKRRLTLWRFVRASLWPRTC